MLKIELSVVLKGKIHSFETFAATDGPGVRFLVFMHGCPFRCAYCHNPDTWASPEWFEATADDILTRALRYREYWGEDGGLSVSGGEPMLQAAFVADLFEKAHARGITTCLDTSAACFDEANDDIVRLLAATDTVLLDIKHLDEDAHVRLTGKSNAPVLACARYLSAQNRPTWIRHVLVPGLTDDPDHLKRLGAFIRTLSNVERIDVLPYHTFGVEKWKRLGLPYALTDVPEPSPEQLARAQSALA